MTRGPGPREVGRAVDGEDLAAPDGLELAPERRPRRPLPLGDGLARGGTRTASGRASRDRPRAPRPTSSGSKPRPPGRGGPSRRPAGPARGPSGRPRTAGRATRVRRPGPAAWPRSRRLARRVSSFRSRSRRSATTSIGRVLGIGHRADGRDRVEDPLDRRRLERDHGHVGIDRPGDLVHLAIARPRRPRTAPGSGSDPARRLRAPPRRARRATTRRGPPRRRGGRSRAT